MFPLRHLYSAPFSNQIDEIEKILIEANTRPFTNQFGHHHHAMQSQTQSQYHSSASMPVMTGSSITNMNHGNNMMNHMPPYPLLNNANTASVAAVSSPAIQPQHHHQHLAQQHQQQQQQPQLGYIANVAPAVPATSNPVVNTNNNIISTQSAMAAVLNNTTQMSSNPSSIRSSLSSPTVDDLLSPSFDPFKMDLSLSSSVTTSNSSVSTMMAGNQSSNVTVMPSMPTGLVNGNKLYNNNGINNNNNHGTIGNNGNGNLYNNNGDKNLGFLKIWGNDMSVWG